MDISCEALKQECPLDKKCFWKFIYHSTHKNYQLPIYKCETCQLQAVYPRPKIEELYLKGYFTGESQYNYKDERVFEKYEKYVWKARLKTIQKFKQKGKILEIGSAFGGFLNCAKELGYEVLGVEISEYASKYANQRGVKTICNDFLCIDFQQEKFDIIVLIEVIEHLPYPNQVFYKLNQLLYSDGLLILQTSNFEAWQAIKEKENYHYYLPGHFYYYGESNLKKFLYRNNFKSFFSFFGVDFSLFAKLMKSRGNFSKWTDYILKWSKISIYHFKSKLTYKKKRVTSSMVLYSFKN